MKKQILLTATLIGFTLAAAQAQITITSSDMPSAGDTVRFSTSTSTVSSALLNQTGASQTWDFSFLTPSGQDIAAFKTPLNINVAYLLTFGSSSYGRHDADMTIGILQATDVYTFYKNASSSFAVDGRGFSVSGSPLPLTQTYTGKDVLYNFPLTYGASDSNTYVSSEANAIVAQMVTTGKRVNTVDGWGSITTPYGTFNCIRVKSVVRQTDTLKTSIINLPITRNYTEYKWLAKGQKIPILEITVTSGIGGQTTIRYRDVMRPGIFVNKARFAANKTKTIAGDTVKFTDQSQLNPAPVSWQWSITPGTFYYVGGTTAASQNPQVIFTDTGLYTVKLTAGYAAGKDDTTRVNYIQVGTPPTADFAADLLFPTASQVVSFTDQSVGSPTTWQWTFAPNTVSFVASTATSQNPKVVFNAAGLYNVTLQSGNAFGQKSVTKNSYIHVIGTGLQNIAEQNLLVYPNPASSNVFVYSALMNKGDIINLFDITGKQVMQVLVTQATTQLDVSKLVRGVYTLELSSSTGKVRHKLLIQ